MLISERLPPEEGGKRERLEREDRGLSLFRNEMAVRHGEVGRQGRRGSQGPAA